jgi:hypothetical protein
MIFRQGSRGAEAQGRKNLKRAIRDGRSYGLLHKQEGYLDTSRTTVRAYSG